MRMIGFLGGMSWESSIEYYRLANELVRERLGGHASAKCLMWSADFAEIEAMQRDDRWDDAGQLLADAAKGLVAAGADVIALATNTMHLVAGSITAAIDVPFVHVIDAAATAANDKGVRRVGVLGTAYTMTAPVYADRLRAHGLEPLVPDADDRATVHRIIFDELCQGVVTPESRAAYVAVIERLAQQGAEAVLLACTEIMLLVQDGDTDVPLIDTTAVHVDALLTEALR